jgi:FkbM family methyltransferase
MNNNKYYSQYKEDKYLNEIFKKTKGFCLEIGGFDGISGSTTYFFEKLGWDCVIVEPIPSLYQKILTNRKCIVLNCAISDNNGETDFYVVEGVEVLSSLSPDEQRIRREKGGELKKIKVETRTLDNILEKIDLGKIDFMSIDVEGHELAVLKGFSIKKFNPKILLIENNFVGAGDNDVEKYLKKFDFLKFKITGCNEWYTHRSNKDIYSKFDLLVSYSVELKSKIDYNFRRLIKKIVPASVIRLLRGN